LKVLVAKQRGVVEYIDIPKPEAKNDMVVAKVVNCGICATDISILRGDASFINDGSTSYPIRFGHEWSGIVESVGQDVKNFQPGDRVISDSGVSCGVCENCRKGNFRTCRNNRAVGTIRTWPGAFAEYVSFPERHLHHIPDGISFEGAAIIEPGAIAVSGIKRLDLQLDATVLVIGTGAIGLTAVAFAKYLGAKKVILAGRTERKLHIGKKMGADYVVNTKNESLKEFIDRECQGGVYNILECSGNIKVMNDCIDVLGREGSLVLAGFFEEKYTDFNVDAFILKHGHMHAAMGGYKYTQIAIEGVGNGVDLTPVITKRILFEDADCVMMGMANSSTNSEIKVMVSFE